MAIEGDTIVVGASFDDDRSGSAYVFTRTGTAWTEQAKLTASDAADDDFFGASVAINVTDQLAAAAIADGAVVSGGSDLTLSATGSHENTTVAKGGAGDNGSGGAYIYRSSKAALNAVVKSLSVDLAPRGIAAIAFHPGWVQTDMGGQNANLTPETSISGMRAVIDKLTIDESGTYWSYSGGQEPW